VGSVCIETKNKPFFMPLVGSICIETKNKPFLCPLWGQFVLRTALINIITPCPTLWCAFSFCTAHSFGCLPVNLPLPESYPCLCYVCLHFPPSRGGSLAHYHVVIISFPRFFPGNRRLGSEPADQKESIGTILKSQVPNMGLNDFSRLPFLQHSSFSFLNENKHL